MKTLKIKLFSLFLMTFLVNDIMAQLTKGTIRIGPDFSYSGNTSEIDGIPSEFKTSTLSLSISAGYYVIDNLELGLAISVTNINSEFDTFEQSESGKFIGPQIAYRVALSDNFYLPIFGGIGLNTMTIDDNFGSETKLSGIGYGAGIGLEYLIAKKIGAIFSLGFNSGSLEEDDSQLELDNTSTVSKIGVNIYFSK